jgi:photosystem II oxygen-evolving enhancer protein 2
MLATLLSVLCFSLANSSVAFAVSGFKSYVDTADGYEFLYPNGWMQVDVKRGPDVVLHDLIESSENVSVVINPVSNDKVLEDLGSPSEVGYRLSQVAIAPLESGRQAELVNAEAHEAGGQTYYLLEYAVKLPNNQLRHNLASVVVRRSKLYTLNGSTTEKRWSKVKSKMETMVGSFKVY